jgi:hypothetical protein
MKQIVFQIQFTLPCEEPADNVYSTEKRGVITLHVPINYQAIHQLNVADLLSLAARRKLLDILTGLNKNSLAGTQKTILNVVDGEAHPATLRDSVSDDHVTSADHNSD